MVGLLVSLMSRAGVKTYELMLHHRAFRLFGCKHACTCARASTPSRARAHTHTHTHTHSHARTHTKTHTHIHMYTPISHALACTQAVEAKEGLEIQNESVTLASVSYQAFFRGFPKLAGV